MRTHTTTAQQYQTIAINIQSNIQHHKDELKKDPKDVVALMMLKRDRARLKTHIYMDTP